MKKTISINLGGIAFTIDEDAYLMLHEYIESIGRHLGNSDATKEVIQDIEARLAELFSTGKNTAKDVINLQQVEAAITAMGKPEDIAGATEVKGESASAVPPTGNATAGRVARKLYRNSDDKKVGGVVSGISAYLGIEDSIWLRLVAIVFIFFSLGTTALVYLILWIIIPEAKTTSQKLEMKGEPITLDNIQKEVSEAANRLNNWSKQESVGERLVALIAALFKIAMKIVAVFVIIVILFMLFGFIAASVGVLSFASLPSVQKLASVYAENGTMAIIGIVGIILVVLMPLLGMLYGGVRVLVGTGGRSSRLKWIFSTGFLIGLLLLAITAINFGINFRATGNVKEQYTLMQPAAGNLFVQLSDSSGVVFDEEAEDSYDSQIFVNGEMPETRTGYKIGRPHLKLMVSKDTSFYIEKLIVAKGKSKAAAIGNARAVNYNFTQVDTILNLNTYAEVKKGSKWRNQNVFIHLAIPEGKLVHFANNIDYLPATVKGDDTYDNTYFANTLWTVKSGKVVCLNCEDEDGDAVLAPPPPLPPHTPEAVHIKASGKETKITTEKGEVTVQTTDGKEGKEVEIKVRERK